MTEKKEYLVITLKNPKHNTQGEWDLIREAVSPWYFSNNGLNDDKLRDLLNKGGDGVEIAFNLPSEKNPAGQRQVAIDKLSSSDLFNLQVYNK